MKKERKILSKKPNILPQGPGKRQTKLKLIRERK